MMETWRLNVGSKNEAPVRRAFDPGTSRPIVQQACNTCRAKKLRCTGEKTGCSRCKALDRVCVYAEAGKKRRRDPAVHDEPRAIQASPTLAPPPSRRHAPVEMSPPARPEEQGNLQSLGSEHLSMIVEGSEIKDRVHMPPTPLSDGPGISEQSQRQPQPAFTVFDICSVADQHDRVSGLDESSIFEQWPLMDTIDLEHWDPTLASPPEKPARLNTAPQDSVQPSGSTPANEVSQQPADLIDLLSGQNSQSVVEPTSPTVQCGQAPELAVRPETTVALEDSHQTECRCLQPVVFLIDELEAGRNTVASQGLDAGLASHKEALRYGQALIECQRCRSRPEHMTILKFLTDKLAGLSEQIVAEYTRALMHPAAASAGAMGTGVRGADHDRRSGSIASTPPWPAVLGTYEVDSAREWNTLIGGLIGLQLEALHTLAESMKTVSRSMRWDAMFGRMAAMQRMIVPMMYRIQSLCRPGGGTVDAAVFCDPK